MNMFGVSMGTLAVVLLAIIIGILIYISLHKPVQIVKEVTQPIVNVIRPHRRRWRRRSPRWIPRRWRPKIPKFINVAQPGETPNIVYNPAKCKKGMMC
jgi:hypothetical protein